MPVHELKFIGDYVIKFAKKSLYSVSHLVSAAKSGEQERDWKEIRRWERDPRHASGLHIQVVKVPKLRDMVKADGAGTLQGKFNLTPEGHVTF